MNVINLTRASLNIDTRSKKKINHDKHIESAGNLPNLNNARLVHPKIRLEAITSYPMLLSGNPPDPACQSLPITAHLTHAAGDPIKPMIASIRKGLDCVLANAHQLPKANRCTLYHRQNYCGQTEKFTVSRLVSTLLCHWNDLKQRNLGLPLAPL